MYRFSRSIYRELAPHVIEDPRPDWLREQAEGPGRLRGRNPQARLRPPLLRAPGAVVVQRGTGSFCDGGSIARLDGDRAEHLARTHLHGAATGWGSARWSAARMSRTHEEGHTVPA